MDVWAGGEYFFRDADFLKSVLDALPDSIAIIRADGVILCTNAAWTAFARDNGGLPEKTGPSINYFDTCMNPSARGDVLAQRAMRGIKKVADRRVGVFELEYPCHSATEKRWFVMRATRLGLDGQALILISHIDITQRKQLEEQFLVGFESLTVGSIVIGENGRIRMFNAAAEKIFGYRRGEAIGRNVNILMPEPDRSRHDGYLRNYKKTGEAKIIGRGRVVTGMRKDGTEFPMHLGIGKIEMGAVNHYIGAVTDLTELNKALDALEAALEDAKAASEAKSTFLATMSHELRTPLNSILGFSGMLEQEFYGPLGDPRYKEYVDIIHASGERLLNFVNDILDLSRIESGEYRLADVALCVANEIEASLRRCAATNIDYESGAFSVAVDACPLPLIADQRAVSQILDNLLTNAFKYAGHGADITISWQADPEGRGVLMLSDTGPGIPDQVIARITEPFVHGANFNPHVSKASQGVGLGLHIVAKLASLHGASLDIDGGSGQGTKVMIRFPQDRLRPEDWP